MLIELKNIDLDMLILINRTFSNEVFDFLCPIFREKKTWLPLYAVILFLWVKRFGKEAFWLVLSAAVLVLFSDQLALFSKNYFLRIRPCADQAVSQLILLRTAVCSQQFSFVSSHAANHFAQAVFYSFVFRKWYATTAFLLWAFVVSFSQVYVGVHYPSDVLAGGLLGALLAYLIYRICFYFKPFLFPF